MQTMIKFISNQEAQIAEEDFDEKILYARMFFGNEDYETFDIDITDWSKERYIEQWKHAVDYALKNRAISLFFKDFRTSTPHNIMRSFVYIITPEEMVDVEKFDFDDDKNFEKPQDFYITERMIYATTDVNNLCSEKVLNIIKDDDNVYTPVYYVNPDKLDWFYPYIGHMFSNINIQTIWYKKISKKYLESILEM